MILRVSLQLLDLQLENRGTERHESSVPRPRTLRLMNNLRITYIDACDPAACLGLLVTSFS